MRRTNFLVKFLLLFFNLIALNISYLLAFIIRFYDLGYTQFYEQQYHILLIFLNLIMVIISIRDRAFTEFESLTLKKSISIHCSGCHYNYAHACCIYCCAKRIPVLATISSIFCRDIVLFTHRFSICQFWVYSHLPDTASKNSRNCFNCSQKKFGSANSAAA